MQADAEARIEYLRSRIEELEEYLEGILDLFQTSTTGNSTFEGGMDLLDIEVSDEVEALLMDLAQILDEGPSFEVGDEV